ncbi:tryptophan-rich sensory protein [Candidatus Peregrinibacteria bacterium]|nr:MAG: tryptophan-rich sensory protein [Candidatus Peregrinibacteria bacterium]
MLTFLKKLFHLPQTSKKERIVSGLVATGMIFGAGWLGANTTQSHLSEYATWIRPELTPPNYVFSFVWTLLFIGIIFAGYQNWNHFEKKMYRNGFAALYLLNAVLICTWSALFFGQGMMASALFTIFGLILVAELMILISFKNNRKAGYALLPYLLWLIFAAYLNTGFLVLNATV